jgi:hypothetical protein
VVFNIYWDKGVAEGPWPAWVDDAINFLGEHGVAQAGDATETDDDDDRIVQLTAIDPYGKTTTYLVTMTSGKDADGHDALVVSDIQKV